ncbi:MAG: TonB-dependent receptor [Bacteroidota bacterium]
MKLKLLLYPCVLLFLQTLFSPVMAQGINVTGTVMSKQNDPLDGATVTVKGTKNSTTTNSAGQFSINVPKQGSVLVITYTGMATQSITVPASGIVSIKLEAGSVSNLDEVVVVGYGTQKKRVLTGAVSSVKASDLENMPLNNIAQSLQGRTSGVVIAANSGQPGSAATVRVRGITSFNNNTPLWVVDGVVVDNGGINYLNQSDIESIEVLKDASSQAIYGARAAAGVVLVTTKKGKAGSIRVSYNGFYGISSPAKKLDMLNATDYATLRNESAAAAGLAKPYANPASYGAGTDWQSLIFNDNANRQNHEFSISGGNDRSTFYMSFGLVDQEGIVATEISNYKRVAIRLNSTHKLAKWLTVGQNIGYAYGKSIGLGNTNSEFGGPLSSAINLDPITPAVVTDPAVAALAPYTNIGIRRNSSGQPFGISSVVGQEITNPLAYIQTRIGNYSYSNDFVGNVYAEAEPIKGLKLRSTLGAKMSFWGGESFAPLSWLNSSSINSRTNYNRNMNKNLGWNLENTASYTRSFGDHNLTLLVGQGAYSDGSSNGTSVTYFNVPAENFKDASLNYNVPSDQRVSSGYEGQDHVVSSLFTRLNYNFKEKYLFQSLVRRDGSSRFGANNKYGIFPSFSAGWVASSEAFFPLKNLVSFMKVRGGYGVVGSDDIGDFAYVSTIGDGRSYPFGTSGSYAIGYSPNAPANPDLKWEETRQTNIGFDANFLKNFNVSFDWFKKETVGILTNPRIPGYVGAISNPAANVANMENTGFEIELGYRKKIGQFNLGLSGNISHYKNKVTYLGNNILFTTTSQQSFQSSSYPITRSIIGMPFNTFFGFQTLGIFQNQAEVDAYVGKSGTKIQPNAKPGDFRWEDIDGNGLINDLDRKVLGSPLPTITYGFTINLAYKAFDLTVFGQGVGGNKIFQGLRRLDILTGNWQTKALGRWTGEGTSTSFPRLVQNDPNRNFTNPSDFYLEDGDYFRLKNVQLGFTLPAAISRKVGLQKARFYLTGENLVTWTKYTGYDPEIGGGAGSGIDRGIYPQARSIIVGINLGF